tara:strand:+ start:876 stop:1337 length:462 start_codon:yes stop_codon:yes gene_type:complete
MVTIKTFINAVHLTTTMAKPNYTHIELNEIIDRTVLDRKDLEIQEEANKTRIYGVHIRGTPKNMVYEKEAPHGQIIYWGQIEDNKKASLEIQGRNNGEGGAIDDRVLMRGAEAEATELHLQGILTLTDQYTLFTVMGISLSDHISNQLYSRGT